MPRTAVVNSEREGWKGQRIEKDEFPVGGQRQRLRWWWSGREPSKGPACRKPTLRFKVTTRALFQNPQQEALHAAIAPGFLGSTAAWTCQAPSQRLRKSVGVCRGRLHGPAPQRLGADRRRTVRARNQASLQDAAFSWGRELVIRLAMTRHAGLKAQHTTERSPRCSTLLVCPVGEAGSQRVETLGAPGQRWNLASTRARAFG